MWLHLDNWLRASQGAWIFSGTLAQDSLNIADREDVKELRDVGPQSQLGTLVFVEFRDISDWLLRLLGQKRNDSRLVGLLLCWGGHRRA